MKRGENDEDMGTFHMDCRVLHAWSDLNLLQTIEDDNYIANNQFKNRWTHVSTFSCAVRSVQMDLCDLENTFLSFLAAQQ